MTIKNRLNAIQKAARKVVKPGEDIAMLKPSEIYARLEKLLQDNPEADPGGDYGRSLASMKVVLQKGL